MGAFKYDDKKPAKWWIRGSIRVERAKDGTFTLTCNPLDEMDEYAEDFCGRETYAYDEAINDTSQAVYKMVAKLLTETYGSELPCVIARGYLPDDWQEPLTEAEKREKELAELAADLRAMIDD